MSAAHSLTRTPFSLSPSPATLYITPGLRAAIHKTQFVIDQRQGLTAILGDVGMGKSSLLRLIAGDYAARDDVRSVFIPQPSYKSNYAFTKAVAAQLGLPAKRSLYDQSRALEEYLTGEFRAGRNVVLFVDEAQRLDDEMLEQVRAFLNYETNTDKLVQVVLAGQLELRDRLVSKAHRALRSRMFAPSLLDPLTPSEADAMLAYRCEVAGIAQPFPADVRLRMYEVSAGIPRELLKLASLAYEIMRIAGEAVVTPAMLAGAESQFRLLTDGGEL